MKETPAFDIATIYINAFSAVSLLSMTQLQKKDIFIFTNILEKQLISSYGCKYVYYQFDKYEEKKFEEDYYGEFTVIGDDIYQVCEQSKLEKLETDHNSIYNKEIQQVMENTRDNFLLLKTTELNCKKMQKALK